jgi:hypothetical protein
VLEWLETVWQVKFQTTPYPLSLTCVREPIPSMRGSGLSLTQDASFIYPLQRENEYKKEQLETFAHVIQWEAVKAGELLTAEVCMLNVEWGRCEGR